MSAIRKWAKSLDKHQDYDACQDCTCTISPSVLMALIAGAYAHLEISKDPIIRAALLEAVAEGTESLIHLTPTK
jgi:hypothetical protein